MNEQELKRLRKKELTKKALKEFYAKERGPLLPPNKVIESKKYKNKYKEVFDDV